MIPHVPYDQELYDFQKASAKHPLVCTSSKLLLKSNQALFNLIFENLLAQKKTLIISKEAKKADRLISLFEQYDLHKLILHLKDLNIVEEHDKASFLKANIPNKCLELNDLEKLNSYAAVERKKINAIYEDLNKPCFGSKTYQDLVHAYLKVSALTGKAEMNLDLNESTFALNKSEFWNLREGLNACIAKYNPIFNIIDQAQVVGQNFDFSNNDNQSSKNQNRIDTQILNVESIIKSLRSDLNHYVESFKKQFKSQKELTLNGLKEIRENLIFIKYHVKQENSGFLGLAKKKKIDTAPLQLKLDTLLQSFNQDIQSKNILGMALQADLNADSLTEAIKALESSTIAPDQIELISQKLNLNHLDGAKKTKITKLIETTVSNLNESELLSSKIENGGFTFKHKLQSFEQILQNLISLKNLQHQLSPYLNWKKFYQNQTRELKHILNALKRYPPKDWILLFEAWYISKLIEKHKPHTDTLNYYFDYTAKFERRILEEKLAYIQNLYAGKRETAKQSLKKQNKKLYNKITSKKNEIFNWNDLLSTSVFLSEFYPVVISADIESLQQNKFYDRIIFLDNYELLDSTDLINIAPNVSIFGDVESSYIKAFLKEKEYKSCKLEVPYQQALQALEINQSNRFPLIKKLAKNIFEINENYQYYQTKKLSIISFCSDQNNTSLTDYFESNAIKALPKTNSELGIIENLLDPQKDIIVLFDDGLLNAAQSELYLWQFHLIQCLQSIGAHCFSISSEAIFTEGQSYLEKIWKEIDALSPEVKHQKATLVDARSN